jgi:cell wall assembly regulator SMI1
MDLGEAVHALAREIHEYSPEGRTVFTACRSNGGNIRWAGELTPEQWLTQALLDEGPSVVYELVVRPSGEFRFTHTHDLDRTLPTIIVRDKDFWVPGHPTPGDIPQPEHTKVTDAPTDPAVLARLIERFGAGEGNSEVEILAAERELGLRLPEALRALYRIGHTDLGDHRLWSLEELVDWHTGVPVFGSWDLEQGSTVFETVCDVWPYGHVKRLCRNDWWLVFAAMEDGVSHLAVDLDPGPAGRPGQVIWFDDTTNLGGYVAESVEGALVPSLPPDEPITVEEDVSPWMCPAVPRYERGCGKVLDLTPDPSLQLLRVRAVAEVDMAELAVFPILRHLDVREADRVVPANLPALEWLTVEAREFDPTPLAGNATLWSLSLHGLDRPVDARVIATMASLIRLDLSDVEVTDIEALAELPALRMLVLNEDQWAQVELPNLAVMVLGGGTLAERMAWLDRYDPLDQARELHVIEGSSLKS